MVPGVYDCVSAMTAAAAGFRAVAVSGYCVEASLLGRPDLGFTGLSDMEQVARRIANSVHTPVICDADTGYGDGRHVWDTTRRLEAAGAQGIHIEDQTDPKRCGGMAGRQVIHAEEMVLKVQSAVGARRTDDLLVIARSDAKESGGLHEVVRRLNRYADAGADIAFAAEPYTLEELRVLGQEVAAPLAICAGVPGWPDSSENKETYAELGVRMVLYPFLSLYPAFTAMRRAYADLAAHGAVSPQVAQAEMVSFNEFNEFIGLSQWESRAQP